MNIKETYSNKLTKEIESLQTAGETPMEFAYVFNDKSWVIFLPDSVMEQKKLIGQMNDYFTKNAFEQEAIFIKSIGRYCRVNGGAANPELLTLGEIEVLKTAYTDKLLLPLFQGGVAAVEKFMEVQIS